MLVKRLIVCRGSPVDVCRNLLMKRLLFLLLRRVEAHGSRRLNASY